MNPPGRPYFSALIAIFFWGTMAPFCGTQLRNLRAEELLCGVFAVSLLFALLSRAAGWTHAGRSSALASAGVGLIGMYGFHEFYFRAMSSAPQIEANILAETWPLQMVLFSRLILGQKISPRSAGGVLLGFAGAAILAWRGEALTLGREDLPGYLMAFLAGTCWALYSVLLKSGESRGKAYDLLPGVAATFILSIAALVLVRKAWGPAPLPGPFLCLYLGAGPIGAAFIVWDSAMRKGDPQKIAALSYLTPLIATLGLILLSGESFRWTAGLGLALILAGCVLGTSQEKFRRGDTETQRALTEGAKP